MAFLAIHPEVHKQRLQETVTYNDEILLVGGELNPSQARRKATRPSTYTNRIPSSTRRCVETIAKWHGPPQQQQPPTVKSTTQRKLTNTGDRDGRRLVGGILSFGLCHWLPVGGWYFVIWVESLLCWCGCRVVGDILSFGLCHYCVCVAAGWWVTVCDLGCVTFVLVWLPGGG